MTNKKKLPDSTKECAIFAADMHILKKPGMWSGRAEIKGDDLFALNQVVDTAIEHQADLYLGGDILDAVTNLPRPIVNIQEAFNRYFAAVEDGHIRYIQGQHEIVVNAHYENYPWLSLIPQCEYMGHTSFKFFGFKAFALDYFSLAFEDLLLSQIPKGTQVLFLHGSADVATPFEPHFHVEKLPDTVKIILAGDWHICSEYALPNNGRLFYPGSTWMNSSSECIEKHVLKVTKDGNALKVDQIPLKTRPIYKVSTLDLEKPLQDQILDDPNLIAQLPEELQTPVFIVDVPTDPAGYAQLMQHGHIHTTGSANPDVPTVDEVNKERKLSNEEILARYADKDKYPDQFQFTLDVIENPAQDAIERLKEKLGITEEDLAVV